MIGTRCREMSPPMVLYLQVEESNEKKKIAELLKITSSILWKNMIDCCFARRQLCVLDAPHTALRAPYSIELNLLLWTWFIIESQFRLFVFIARRLIIISIILFRITNMVYLNWISKMNLYTANCQPPYVFEWIDWLLTPNIIHFVLNFYTEIDQT